MKKLSGTQVAWFSPLGIALCVILFFCKVITQDELTAAVFVYCFVIGALFMHLPNAKNDHSPNHQEDLR